MCHVFFRGCARMQGSSGEIFRENEFESMILKITSIIERGAWIIPSIAMESKVQVPSMHLYSSSAKDLVET